MLPRQIRNNMADGLETLHDVIGAQSLAATLLPTLLELANDAKWRVRMGIVSKLGLLAKALGTKLFEKRVHNILVLSLSDHVHSVRERTCEQAGVVVQTFGYKWALEKVVPAALGLWDKTQNYLHRMTCLQFILHVLPHCPAEVIEKQFLPVICAGLVDDVPNVRVAAAKVRRCARALLCLPSYRIARCIVRVCIPPPAHSGLDSANAPLLSLPPSQCGTKMIPKLDKKQVARVKELLTRNITEPDLDVAYSAAIASKLCA